jgi:flavin reductase (DIM6/NTAB) family NADH-FMN oxidoreductase RutF
VTVTPIQLDADLFRALLRRHAAGVAVVTAPGNPPAGFTATSFTSVSLDPPLVSFCLANTSSVWPAIVGSDIVAVHVLGRSQEQVARTFAARGIDRFAAHRDWTPGPGGVPLLDGVLARLVCRVTQRVPAGDHTIVLAAPVSGEHGIDETEGPLVYHAGAYAQLGRFAA